MLRVFILATVAALAVSAVDAPKPKVKPAAKPSPASKSVPKSPQEKQAETQRALARQQKVHEAQSNALKAKQQSTKTLVPNVR